MDRLLVTSHKCHLNALILCLLFFLLVIGLPLPLVVGAQGGFVKDMGVVSLHSILVKMHSVFLPVKLKGKARG